MDSAFSGRNKSSAASRGYDTRWRRLSERARKLQPFCSDCGATQDLQTDHSPEAWERYLAGKSVRLKDVDVVCGACNRRRGQARPVSTGAPENGSPVLKPSERVQGRRRARKIPGGYIS